MSTSREKAGPPTHDFAREIWGIVFCALGTLIFVSLISHYLDNRNNVLGPYIGTGLAAGLRYIFGDIAAFLFPSVVMLLGIDRLRPTSLDRKALLYGFLFTAELCLFSAIPSIPITEFRSNLVGHALAYLLQKVFGPNQFGPYFVASIATLVTILVCFRINVTVVTAGAGGLMAAAAKSIGAGFTRLRDRPTPVKGAVSRPEAHNRPPQERSKRKGAEAQPPQETAAPPRQEEAEPEDESQRRLEKELAEFRAKKNQPVTITTAESVDAEAEGEQTEAAEDPPTPDVTTTLSDGNDGYYKVPQMMKPVVKRNLKPYVIPPPDIISDPPPYSSFIDRESIERHSQILEKTLMNFAVEGKVVNVSPGPVITRYEIELAPGIKVSRVLSLQDDISMAVGGQKIRIQAPIPGKAAIGIELPNENRQTVYFKHILSAEAFQKSKSKLPIVVGRTISGSPFATDIAKMPHLLIAGQTGAGKSVCINSFICSLLMTKTPEELRFIMVDPKRVELAAYYQGIPHLLAPVVTESKEAIKALRWGEAEMERRYKILAKVGARNIESFNARIASEKVKEGILTEEENKQLPFIVIIVDELADLMMTASKDVEASIQRIAQLARAVGLHLIVATQRPSVDIITGPIKANLTSRIAFRTIQSTDSRTILGHVGSEKLLGQGDMLFLRSGAPDIERFHAAFISEEDVETITNTIRGQSFEIEKLESFNDDDDSAGFDDGGGDGAEHDELFEQAARTIVSIGQGSTSLLQRRMKIGFARAGRLMDELERAGIVGPQEGSKVREVLVRPDELDGFLASL